MKNINKIVMLIVLAVCAMACNDDFLERRPLNSISIVVLCVATHFGTI